MRIDRIMLISEMAKQDMDVKTLAAIVGIHPQTLGNIRRGISCRYETAMALAQALSVPAEELFQGKEGINHERFAGN